MKKVYCSPTAKLVLFKTEEILGLSSENSLILDPKDGNNPNNPAEDFGSIQIF